MGVQGAFLEAHQHVFNERCISHSVVHTDGFAIRAIFVLGALEGAFLAFCHGFEVFAQLTCEPRDLVLVVTTLPQDVCCTNVLLQLSPGGRKSSSIMA